jgi:hypothetical protein
MAGIRDAMTLRARLLVVAAVLAALLLGAGVALLVSDDGDEGPPDTTTSSSAVSSSTTTTNRGVDTSTAVWPFASSSTRYATPTDAARGFAVEFLGFVEPSVGELRQGDLRSGEVDIRFRGTGPVTTVLVRQLGPDDSWWVLGAATANIQVTAPTAGSPISSPVALAGTSTAFEGTVQVQVREDGNPVSRSERAS